MAKKPGTTKALTKYDAKLAEMAAAASKTVGDLQTGGNIIGTAGGILKYKGTEIPDNMIRVVILDFILANLWYEGNFDPGNPDVPACFAYGREKEGMAPHEKSGTPQNDICAGCQQNEWGSADRGNGKACKNAVRLALISEGDLEGDITTAEIAYIHVPVTSVKTWAGYSKNILETAHLNLFQVVTEITLTKDPQVQFRMGFKSVEQVDNKFIGELIDKAEQAKKEIDFPYIAIERPEQPARRGKPNRGGRNVVPAGRRGGAVPRRNVASAARGKNKFA